MRDYEAAAAVALAVLLLFVFLFAQARGEKRRIILVNSNGDDVFVDAEVASDPATKAKGLMGRKTIGENEGMLFVFGASGYHSFWMLNTSIPLDAIHFSENGTVVDIIHMEPCGLNALNCTAYRPRSASRYVLEVNRGFSQKNAIEIGNSRFAPDSIGPGG